MNTKKLTITALLTALAMILPFVVAFKVIIPPFSATIGSHVPMFIAMLLGPKVAVMVGVGSCLGFTMTLGPLVGARAFMHVFIGALGAKLIERDISMGKVFILTAPLHGILEALVVMPFIGFHVYNLLVVTALGTMLHHIADAVISYTLVKILGKSKTIAFLN